MPVGDARLDQEGTVEELEAKIVGTGSCVSLPRHIMDEKRGTLSEMSYLTHSPYGCCVSLMSSSALRCSSWPASHEPVQGTSSS